MKFDDYQKEQMKDPEFREIYESLRPEYEIMSALIDARCRENLTQKELADKVGMSQADISKLENGTRNPSLNLLKKIAKGLNSTLRIEFVHN